MTKKIIKREAYNNKRPYWSNNLLTPNEMYLVKIKYLNRIKNKGSNLKISRPLQLLICISILG